MERFAAASLPTGMAAASFKTGAIFAGLLLTACSNAADGPAGNEPAAAPTTTPHASVTSNPASPAGTADPLAPASPTDCNAPQAERFVGEQATPAVRESLTEAVAPITVIRWVGPGQATTEDYNPQRLNVMLDVGGLITAVHCG